MTKTNIKELSIQVKLSGLSFCILNRTSNTIEHLYSIIFDKKLTPYEVLNRLKAELSSNTIYSDEFSAVQVIHHNSLSTIVPKSLYDKDHSADYLKFNSKILKTDFISEDDININDAVNVYVPYVNVNNYIFDTFGEFVYKHSSTILIDTIVQRHLKSESVDLHINVNSQTFELIVTDKGALTLYNIFEYQTVEDFAYYTLFTIEQLQLDPETINVSITGIINEDDDKYKVLYKYLRHISIEDVPSRFDFDSSINAEDTQNHLILLNSF